MLVANDKIRAEFLLKIHKISQQYLEDNINIWDQQRDNMINETKESLKRSLESLCEKYRYLQEKEETGELRYVYLSFLRSSILDHTPWYRLDAYDSRNCISEVECAESLDFYKVSHCFYIGVEKMQTEFNKQTRIKGYELDGIIYQLAEQFHQKNKCLFYKMYEDILKESGTILFGESCIDINVGELFGNSEFLIGWNQGRIVSADEYRQQEEDNWEEGD